MKRKHYVRAAVLLLLLLLGLGLWQYLRPKDTPPPELEDKTAYLLVPREMAGKFKLKSADQIIRHCRENVRAARYDGILRGAHGALWGGEANALDRVLLTVEALQGAKIEARILSTDPPRLAYRDGAWKSVSLEDNAAPDESEAMPAGALTPEEFSTTLAEHFHQIVPSLVLESGAKTDRITAKTPETLAAWVHQPVLLKAEGSGDKPHYVLRVGDREVVATGSLTGVRRATLELLCKFKGKETTHARELFDVGNAAPEIPGHDAPRAGDRYALVICAGPLRTEVLDTRGKMLESDRHTPLKDKVDRDLITLGVKYQVDADKNTADLAAKTSVELAWTTPRITIVASELSAKAKPVSKEDDPPPGLTIDVLADRVEATGKRAREFHLARGMANDVIETRVLFEATKRQVISASTILSRFKAQRPDMPERRIGQIFRAAQRILAEEPIGTKLRLSALPSPDVKKEDKTPSLLVERAAGGLLLHGAVVAGKKTAEGFRWDETQTASFSQDTLALAIAADGLLAKQTRPEYELRIDVLSGWPVEPLPITNGSVLRYRVHQGGKAYSITVLVALKDGVPGGMWSTVPEGLPWYDLITPEGPRFGEISGRWPDAVSKTPVGPALESYLVSGGDHKGETAKADVVVASKARALEGIKIPLPSASDWVEAESGGHWYGARLVRDKGLIERRPKDREYEDHVRYLSAKPRQEDWMPRKRWRPLRPIEVKTGDKWRLANWLDTTEGKRVVHICGEADKRQTVAPEETRDIHLVEAERDGNWHPAALLASKGDNHQVRFLDDATEKTHMLPRERVRLGETPPAKDAHAIILASGQLPLLLAYQNGDTSLKLEATSPVVVGRAVDAEAGVPVADAEVSRARGKWRVRSASDGSFALHLDDPLFPMSSFVTVGSLRLPVEHPSVRKADDRHILLLVDQSEAMKRGMEGEAIEEAPAGKQRQDALRKQVKDLMTKILAPQDRNRVSLWSFAGTAKGDKPEPKAVIDQLDFVPPNQTYTKLDALKPDGAGALASAVLKLSEEAAKKRLPENVAVVLFSTGENVGGKSPAQVYREGKCALPIHVFGLGIQPGSKADKELSELAQVSGGSYRITNAKAPFTLDTRSFQAQVVGLPVDITSTCHVPLRLSFPVETVGLKPVEARLLHECRCKDKARKLLTITRKNVDDLKECEGLSPRARQWIAERVKEASWRVTIPNRRVNIGAVTAYGWFETEEATGRLVGRTEDGLHGAIADPDNWPSFDPSKGPGMPPLAEQIPFTVWYQGIVSYTTGSVLAGLKWHKSPGFLSGGPEEFKRFVQANALDFAATWWEEVGSNGAGHFAEYYWSGVCLNFVLQSEALGLPPDGCFRRWGENLCNRARDAIAAAGPELAGDALDDLLEDTFGEEKSSLVRRAIDLGFKDFADEFNDVWHNGVKEGIRCERLRGGKGKTK